MSLKISIDLIIIKWIKETEVKITILVIIYFLSREVCNIGHILREKDFLNNCGTPRIRGPN